eukprot:27905_1
MQQMNILATLIVIIQLNMLQCMQMVRTYTVQNDTEPPIEPIPPGLTVASMQAFEREMQGLKSHAPAHPSPKESPLNSGNRGEVIMLFSLFNSDGIVTKQSCVPNRLFEPLGLKPEPIKSTSQNAADFQKRHYDECVQGFYFHENIGKLKLWVIQQTRIVEIDISDAEHYQLYRECKQSSDPKHMIIIRKKIVELYVGNMIDEGCMQPTAPVAPVIEGRMWKQGDDIVGQWRSRWFKLFPDGLLYYYKEEGDQKAKNELEPVNIKNMAGLEKSTFGSCVEKGQYGLIMRMPATTGKKARDWKFGCLDGDKRERWFTAFNQLHAPVE